MPLSAQEKRNIDRRRNRQRFQRERAKEVHQEKLAQNALIAAMTPAEYGEYIGRRRAALAKNIARDVHDSLSQEHPLDLCCMLPSKIIAKWFPRSLRRKCVL